MDKINREARSKNMAMIGSKNTKPELIVRKEFRKLGLRYRIHYPLLGKPDIVFPSKKVSVFVHGCFWHGHGCKNDHIPKSNKKFWYSKIETNKRRDISTRKSLTKSGWKVIVIWECEIEINKVKDFRNKINQIVYKLYGLTPAEIEVIEDITKRE